VAAAAAAAAAMATTTAIATAATAGVSTSHQQCFCKVLWINAPEHMALHSCISSLSRGNKTFCFCLRDRVSIPICVLWFWVHFQRKHCATFWWNEYWNEGQTWSRAKVECGVSGGSDTHEAAARQGIAKCQSNTAHAHSRTMDAMGSEFLQTFGNKRSDAPADSVAASSSSSNATNLARGVGHDERGSNHQSCSRLLHERKCMRDALLTVNVPQLCCTPTVLQTCMALV